MADEQRTWNEIKMTRAERDAFLSAERICRVATASPVRGPHVSPLWFVWDGEAIWLKSLVKSQRWIDLERDPRTSVVVDAGNDLEDLRGVELRGRVEQVGEVPRVGGPNRELEEPERLYSRKYHERDETTYDDRHAWLRLVPERIVSWDFSKG